MRRHESRRGAKVTGDADPEGVEPPTFWLVSADGFVPPVGNEALRNGERRRYSPGSEALSSLTLRIRGHQGDLSVGPWEAGTHEHV
jgi:hypothetical protein